MAALDDPSSARRRSRPASTACSRWRRRSRSGSERVGACTSGRRPAGVCTASTRASTPWSRPACSAARAATWPPSSPAAPAPSSPTATPRTCTRSAHTTAPDRRHGPRPQRPPPRRHRRPPLHHADRRRRHHRRRDPVHDPRPHVPRPRRRRLRSARSSGPWSRPRCSRCSTSARSTTSSSATANAHAAGSAAPGPRGATDRGRRPTESEFEERLPGRCAAASDVPAPERQFYVDPGDGEPMVRLDFAWPEHRYAVETDGRKYHRTRRAVRGRPPQGSAADAGAAGGSCGSPGASCATSRSGSRDS